MYFYKFYFGTFKAILYKREGEKCSKTKGSKKILELLRFFDFYYIISLEYF